MKCKHCDGKGKTTEYDGLRKFWCDYKCEVCNGTGEVQTNEEWFCGLDTEDKAREISDMTAQGYWEEELVYKWLKEIHK